MLFNIVLAIVAVLCLTSIAASIADNHRNRRALIERRLSGRIK